MFKKYIKSSLIVFSGMFLICYKVHASVWDDLSSMPKRIGAPAEDCKSKKRKVDIPTNEPDANHSEARRIFSQIFHGDDKVDKTTLHTRDVKLPMINKPLQDSHKYLIFDGTGEGGMGHFGKGNPEYYMVNVKENPDLLADINSKEHLAHLPSSNFKKIIASSIPFKCFSADFFINANRLLIPGGDLIINTLHQDGTIIELAAIAECLAAFGFVPFSYGFHNMFRQQLERSCADRFKKIFMLGSTQ